MSDFNENILAGIITTIFGGLLLYGVQILRENRREKRLDKEKNKIGKIKTRHLDENFLSTYLPGSLSVEKILEDFGQPDQLYEQPVLNKDFETVDTVSIYEYRLTNSVILFSTFKDSQTIISITLNAISNKMHPVKCLYIFDQKQNYFGEAKITKEIIVNQIHFERHGYPNWVYAAIQSRYFNREIKHLIFTYIVCSPEVQCSQDMEGKVIDQLCISVNENVYPIINFYDMIADL